MTAATARHTAYAAMLETLSPRASRKIANNTYLMRETDGTLDAPLHGHAVVSVAPNGAVTLNQCGWPTLTTRERINAFLSAYADSVPTRDGSKLSGYYRSRYTVFTARKITYLRRYEVDRNEWSTIGQMPAQGPVTIGPRGAVHGLETAQASKRDAKLRAMIRDYCKSLQAELPLPMPGAGDCMSCSMFDGPASPAHLPAHLSTDHLLSHISKSERYYVPSLVWNALLYNGCTPNGAGSAYFAAAFGDWEGYPRERVSAMVRKYLKRCLQVA